MSQDNLSISRPPDVVTADADRTVADAARLMRDNNVGCVIVTGADGQVCGIISERDIITGLVAGAADAESTRLGDAMTARVTTLTTGASLADAQEVMADLKVRHVPVVAEGKAVGMVSSRDVMVEQLLAARRGRAAAEEVAKLAKSFKTHDFKDLLHVIVREVPRLFGAERAMLCLDAPAGSDDQESETARHRCHCTERDRRQRTDVPDPASRREVLCHAAPASCAALCGASQAIVIPLDVRGFSDSGTDADARQCGYLCMCGVDQAQAPSADLLFYEGTLVREILCGVLSNARMYQDARESYLTDPLTGVGTRRLLDERLAAECVRAARYNRPLCLAIVDVDHFKTVNDQLGHDVGDKLLRQVAKLIIQQKRRSDVVARYGGDEFVLLMPETSMENAVAVMERMRTAMADIVPGGDVAVTLSCGVAEQVSNEQESGGDLFRRADLALFEAKRAGRNCTRSWRNVSNRLGFDDYLNNQTVRDLQQQVLDLSAEAKDAFAENLWSLVRAIEARDPHTKSHSVQVMHYAVAIARTMGLDAPDIDAVRRAAMIHDIGMIGVPDSILRTCRPLTQAERMKIEQHPRIGVHILQQMRSLEREVPVVRHHHERWDGLGYPSGISGTRIPREARILSVADAFDAITSHRSHRRSRSVAEALEIITGGAKTQFDPAVIRALTRWIDRVGSQTDKGRDVTVADLLEAVGAMEPVA